MACRASLTRDDVLAASALGDPTATPPGVDVSGEARRFACTACGKCCDRGPEIELGEATALADVFIARLMFRVESLPLYEHSNRAVRWSREQGSSLPVRDALQERRVHLEHFSSRDEIDRSRGRSLHLTISALTLDAATGRCPALSDNRCSIYEARPMTCRTVPLHYSRPASVLDDYMARFVRTPGYLCRTTPDAPVILDGQVIASPSLEKARHDALDRAKADRDWRHQLTLLMNDPDTARAAGLPTYAVVLQHSDAGSASLVSMICAWRVARDMGLLSQTAFADICRKQIRLIEMEIARNPAADQPSDLLDLLSDYEVEIATIEHSPIARIVRR